MADNGRNSCTLNTHVKAEHEPGTNQILNEAIIGWIKELYEERNGILGYGQMTITLNRAHKVYYNKKRIRCFIAKEDSSTPTEFSTINARWQRLKSEMYYLRKFTVRGELIQAIENDIPFYNNGRFQK